MKTSKKHLSNPSFVVSLVRLFVLYYQKRATVKVELFILFVGLCVLMRYSMMSSNTNSNRNNRRVVVELKDLNLPVWPPEMIIKSSLYNYKLNHRHDLKKLNYKLDKTKMGSNKID